MGNIRSYGDGLCDMPSPSYAPTLPPTDPLSDPSADISADPSSSNNKAISLYNKQYNWLDKLSTQGPNGTINYIIMNRVPQLQCVVSSGLALYFHPVGGMGETYCYRELENTSDDETTPSNGQKLELENPGYVYVMHFLSILKLLIIINSGIC